MILHMTWIKDKNRLYVILVLVILFLLDMVLVGGILWHGKANFQEVFKNALTKG
jgi:flagellar basal body-associated protein FliL